MTESLTVGDLSFELRRSDKRSSVGITVDRDGSLIVTAPRDCPLDQITRIARQKSVWVHRKLAEKDLISSAERPKEFVSGEGFYYLGRRHRLLLADPGSGVRPSPALRLQHGRFVLRRDERHRAHEHFVSWYARRARPWIRQRVDLYKDRVGVKPGLVEVRDLGHRWGSCAPHGSIKLHWRTILLPPRIIEYLVVHELVHLTARRHTQEFWRAVERAIPDYAARKRWLAENGSRFF